ncbi:MAG: 2TM domain-containing protein [Hydrogenophaga sp.]|uniref:2TM domain-containing protein n=1 Tax=Hydrogenophaga sp. TaxID=1904254 RepID=UPI001DC6420B|nr:2TM domain-containing protein [Hydrogenophaga sp.]MBX3611096.1 2TM domain-containing protein [Hydrogenophaga sp.]
MKTHHLSPQSTDADLDRIARRRVGMRMGWFMHALVYLAVNLGLAALAMAKGQTWAIYPALGWGLGLALHGLGVWVGLGGGGLTARWMADERARLQAQRHLH